MEFCGELGELSSIKAECDAEGFRTISRLIEEWTTGENRFDKPGEALLVVKNNYEVIGVGGLNEDPYRKGQLIGRLRRFYVMRRFRGCGIGRALARELLMRARAKFRYVRLKADTEEASHFYLRLGFRRSSGDDHESHIFEFASPKIQ